MKYLLSEYTTDAPRFYTDGKIFFSFVFSLHLTVQWDSAPYHTHLQLCNIERCQYRRYQICLCHIRLHMFLCRSHQGNFHSRDCMVHHLCNLSTLSYTPGHRYCLHILQESFNVYTQQVQCHVQYNTSIYVVSVQNIYSKHSCTKFPYTSQCYLQCTFVLCIHWHSHPGTSPL